MIYADGKVKLMGRLMNVFDLIRNCLGFAWDDGNEIKNWSSP